MVITHLCLNMHAISYDKDECLEVIKHLDLLLRMGDYRDPGETFVPGSDVFNKVKVLVVNDWKVLGKNYPNHRPWDLLD